MKWEEVKEDMVAAKVEEAATAMEVVMEEVANVEVAAVVHLVTNLEEVEEEAQDKLLHPGVDPEVVEVAMEIKEVMVVAPKEDMAVVLKEAMEAAAAVEAHGEVLPKVKEDLILGAKTKAAEAVMVEEVIPGEKIQDGSTIPWAIKVAKAAGVATPAVDKAKAVGMMAVMAKVAMAAAVATNKEAIIMAAVLQLVVVVEAAAVPCEEEGPEAAVAMAAAANDLLLIR